MLFISSLLWMFLQFSVTPVSILLCQSRKLNFLYLPWMCEHLWKCSLWSELTLEMNLITDVVIVMTYSFIMGVNELAQIYLSFCCKFCTVLSLLSCLMVVRPPLRPLTEDLVLDGVSTCAEEGSCPKHVQELWLTHCQILLLALIGCFDLGVVDSQFSPSLKSHTNVDSGLTSCFIQSFFGRTSGPNEMIGWAYYRSEHFIYWLPSGCKENFKKYNKNASKMNYQTLALSLSLKAATLGNDGCALHYWSILLLLWLWIYSHISIPDVHVMGANRSQRLF